MKGWQWALLIGFVLAAVAGGGYTVVSIDPITGQPSAVVKKIAEAIATAEGYFISGSLSNRSNNPGDISAGGQVIVYPTVEAGWAALYDQVALMFQGPPASRYAPTMTILKVATIYAADWVDWANNVSAYLGVSPDTRLMDITA